MTTRISRPVRIAAVFGGSIVASLAYIALLPSPAALALSVLTGVVLGYAGKPFDPSGRRLRDSDKWCVAQDLRPFGYRIVSTHRSRAAAERASRVSRYLVAYPVDFVRAENKRLTDQDEFDRELRLHPYRMRQHDGPL